MIKVIHISDTHNLYQKMRVPFGDVVIHTGDATNQGSLRELTEFGEWFRALPHMYKIYVAGNHDLMMQDNPHYAKISLYGKVDWQQGENGFYYLQDELLELLIDGQEFSVYGSPWQPWFHNWAFNAHPPQLMNIWAKIPPFLDVLATHGPPHNVLDRTMHGMNVGCPILYNEVQVKSPKIHMFGHIHEDRGILEENGIIYSNGAMVTRNHRPDNIANVFEVYEDGKVSVASQIQREEETEE